MTILQSTGKGAFWFFSIAIPLAYWSLLTWGGVEALPGMIHHFADRKPALTTHIIAAGTALILMPFQFWRRLRSRRRDLHRWIGRTYAMAVLAGGISGFILAINAVAGPLAVLGFSSLALLWIAFTALGVNAARNRDFDRHRRWMIRSAALTFAAVTLRLQLAPVMATGQEFDVWYPVIAWTAWVPNLIIVDLWMWNQDRRPDAMSVSANAARP